jgi:Putative  PD-(D/E)XK family member, (DUF4420)
MASPSDTRFTDAWRALENSSTESGWSTFAISSSSPSLLLAGRHQPDNEESLIVGFKEARLPKAATLAQCRGFGLSVAQIEIHGNRYACLVLTRQPSASVELFTTIVADLIDVLERSGESEHEQLGTLLGRVAAWQSFMSRDDNGVLRAEVELGLIGELQFLRLLLAAGVAANLAVGSWRGPYDSLHDFVFPRGEVEVKTSARVGAFCASVASLDQLDESIVNPLYFAAVQFTLASAGARLPEMVSSLVTDFGLSGDTLHLFRKTLLAAGYHDYAADRYHRQFSYLMTNVFEVGPSFPRLSKGNVPQGVVDAVYRVELDAASLQSRTLADVLPLLGY